MQGGKIDCAVCYIPTQELTPCGHPVCQPCFHELKSLLCPICRRELPRRAPIDCASLLRDACDADLVGLHHAYRLAGAVRTADGARCRKTIVRAVVDQLSILSPRSLCDALPLVPVQEPSVWMALEERLTGLAEQVRDLNDLRHLAQNVQPIREGVSAVEASLDNVITRAAQRILSVCSLRELWFGAGSLQAFCALPGVDADFVSMNLQEALLRGLDGEFNCQRAQDFAGAVRALTDAELLPNSMSGYVAHAWVARMTCFLLAASLSDLDLLEDEILPCLPATDTWAQASASVIREIARRAGLLLQVQSYSSDSKRTRQESTRLKHIDAVLHELKQIDAERSQVQQEQQLITEALASVSLTPCLISDEPGGVRAAKQMPRGVTQANLHRRRSGSCSRRTKLLPLGG